MDERSAAHDTKIGELEAEVQRLRQENERLKRSRFHEVDRPTVNVPEALAPLFEAAQRTVGQYFNQLRVDPAQATIEVAEQRYVLVRASALSYDFIQTIQSLYAERGEQEALLIGKQLLFDLAHVIGMEDARNFHEKMKLTDPIAKLAAGPVHFAYTGWAFVDVLSESSPSPDQDYFMIYHHPFSFEADSWLRAGHSSKVPVCNMNAGYSSGWSEESFGIELTAVEISCKARGDEHCTFIMAPPDRIEEHIQRYVPNASQRKFAYHIPTFFERKRVEEEREAARRKAEESDRAKTNFLASMSHEIRTPLHAILGYVDLMLENSVTQSEQVEFLKTIQNSGQLLQRLLSDILDLSKIEAHELLIKKEETSLLTVLETTASVAQSLLYEKPVSFHLEVDRNIQEHIVADPGRLLQILNNLVTNAIKFTSEGSITLDVTLHDEQTLLFALQDTGCGIPQQHHEQVFQIFAQAPEVRKRFSQGTGLGLTISQRLVELLGGTIWLTSEEDVGTTFYFTHPYQPVSAHKSTSNHSESSETLGDAQSTVMVVDDNKVNLRLTAAVLERAGFDVKQATNGAEAVKAYQSDPTVDLILMDIQMPVLDGLEAAERIRDFEQQHGHSSTPLIALTAHALQGELERCLDAGYDSYLTKPISSNLLIESISEHLDDKL